MKTKNDLKLAVIIDADNVPARNVTSMMEEIAKYGTPTFKRIYGDWTKPNLAGWKSVLLENAITPIQQYGYTSGKNATDSAMIIDAMDILYTAKVDGFCIVSSDSDFTRLAVRLRESGMQVFGFGEQKTPMPFIVACDKFIYLEILKGSGSSEPSVDEVVPKPDLSKKSPIYKLDKKVIALFTSSINDIADEDGWAFLGDVGNLLIKKRPDFDPRNYGFDKLTPLIKSLKKHFDIDERETDRATIKHVYIRAKKKS
ncbi:OST-HTH/LOTUS domain-containing protein [Ancylomarina subtilis]|uniref:OST-HTH/LOTUS domain-containing protein n=1 Tax=Ancylomarina subtilis TaxID=1639035 RepID=A0A4Q7VMB0_9BACT|nr:NYN domain-containing protein [Ancylomarina subtilis]RZT97277.1 OST-HTH/LOTUS domain-containing protein [Ancylomarina subtilis]